MRRDLLSWGKEVLSVLGQRESLSSAEWLLSYVLQCERWQLQTEELVTSAQYEEYAKLIEKRKNRVPTAYLTHKAYFWDEELLVNQDCLIPRPETELLIEKFIENSGWDKKSSFSFLDLGTGSGAIALALLRTFPHATATLVDVSEETLKVAGENLARYQLEDRAELIESDLFKSLDEKKWDAILSNPPYLSDEDMQNLQPELAYEPQKALHAGEAGYFFYREITERAPLFLNEGGLLGFELGAGQAEKVSGFATAADFKDIQVYPEYNGINRVLMGSYRG